MELEKNDLTVTTDNLFLTFYLFFKWQLEILFITNSLIMINY